MNFHMDADFSIELGREEPTVLPTNHLKLAPATLVTRCAQRMPIENNISESIRFFHMDALSSMVGLKVDFDLQLTLMAGSRYRLMARRIGTEYERAHNPYLAASGLTDQLTLMPWFGNKRLFIRFA